MANQDSKDGFRREMEKENTNYLKRIWEGYNTNEWPEDKLEIIANILRERGEKVTIPSTNILREMLVSSTPILQDKIIKRYLGVVSSEVVIGTGFLSELDGSLADLFGTRATKLQDKLHKAREAALGEISEQTINLGGNAIIGVDYDYMTLSSNIMMVSANGTAVEVLP